MAPSKKRGRFMEWLSRLFLPRGEIRYTPDGPQRHTGLGGFFSHAQDIALSNTTITSVQGEYNTVTYVQGDRHIVPHIMDSLSQHIIRGAAHDSSARSPPPRCHPGTRVKLIARITAWFDGQAHQRLVLWITGPAGVGKSAVVQTFVEYLIKVKLLGASVFFSRPNERNNPHGVFITIAYQLATRIEAYRNFIVERLSLDPELLNGDMQAQFTTFIVEPFVEKQIGAGGRRWGILLDGLDELEGEDAQCEIIQLITAFAHEHPDAPLLWVIASRPESHISNTFDNDGICPSYWSEYIPIDSTEACNDVECFLRSSFKAIQEKYRRSIPSDWPSNTDFLKLTAAASGLFVYAEVVVTFIRDPNHADPVSRLKTLLSVIDRSNSTPTENPFVHLDALYYHILSSIPSNLWPTAKRLLGFLSVGNYLSSLWKKTHFTTPRGISILFGLNLHLIYMCVIKCHSTLGVPNWRVAHKEGLRILHKSFADYLVDRPIEIGLTFNKPTEPRIHVLLRKVHMIKLSYYLPAYDVLHLVSGLVSTDVDNIELLRRIHLKDLKFGHLDWKMMSPASAHLREGSQSSRNNWKLRRPCSQRELKTFVSELKSLQESSPELEGVIFGGVPEGRIVAFRNPLKNDTCRLEEFMYYLIPYPE